ncbi:MAG: endonuclease/exonuclease/phosphatase family protein [Porphyromonas sp.]|uniref:endonuclease/exonuclease/phosphatase family protein n=1 Tax=Porphyromonas sp. TaxID=1924944 RepID=UPI002A7655FC|nr:endonuclease/exonuclease/phosphatase family protein [Porphyromonas sp.]MDD6928997.1 endonuclease/exonuclease/phosphatase family protein [Bacteroidales bacterium]MDY3111428.1 endonuclease/exonuclease/phosphatase family protein [Porphyromonas sp.]MDY4246386.1 endonuclease/exonuclease/phosphatase family protein [Porphyromonas sp.]
MTHSTQYSRWSWLIALLALSFGIVSAQQSTTPQRVTVAFYNLENLFDTIDQENNDEEFLPEGANRWTPERYQHKLRNMSHVISLIGGDGPAIIGVAEIENRGVLEDLIAQDSLRDKHYDIVHYDSPDRRGIDCAILYQPEVYKVFASGARAVEIPNEPWIKTRDVVYASGLLDGEIVHVLVGHWPSRSGGEAVSLHRRMAAAQTMRSVADSLYTLFPGSKVIMMGDFNDDPISPSVRDGLGTQASPDGLKPADYYTPMLQLYNKGMGTLAYRDVWNLFDIIVVNGELIGNNPTTWQLYRDPKTTDMGFIFKQPFMIQQSGQYKGYTLRTFVGGQWQGGYSDHFPVYVYLVKGATQRP